MHNAASTDPPSAASFPDDATSAEAPSERALYARTLGATTLRRTVDGELGPPLLEVGKPLALITYVAASPSRSTSRDALVELLWSDVDPEKGKHALRQTLWYIKKKVGESVLTSRDDAIALAAPLKGDRDELLRASELGDHARVVELHSGDFFPGFAAAGGAAFEQWADLERRRLRAFFFRSAENRTRQLLALGKSREAITLARRARDSDPGNQASWRLILETLTVARDTTSAELEAVALERLAERDDVELEPATRSLLRLTRHEATSADSAPTQSPSFVSEIVGREREFSILLERWAEVKRGKGRHVHLRAPAGIGKTRLLNDLHSRLRSARARVATVRCDMGSRELPYSGASDIAAALSALPGARGVSPSSAASLVALNPSLSSYFSPVADNSSGPEALRRRATALGELAAAVSEEAPLAILVDDVHWMDGASRTVISQLATRCASRRVLLVTTGRPIPEGQLEAPESETLELPSLTETQCAALLATFAELPNVSWGSTLAADLWRASSGSPLHAIETLQLLMERGVLTRDGVAWRCTDEEALRQTLRAGGALARRLGALSEPERAVVILLAASGAPLGQATVVHSTALPSDIADQAFHSLERRGFLARNDREWSLAHDEILAAVEEDTTSDAMQSAHGALGHCLWNENPTEVRELRRAAGHLVRGDGQDALGSLFFRFVRVMRSLSDVRPLHVLAADLLGRHTTAQLAKRLVRSLPLFVRIGLTSRPRRYAALLIVLLVPVTLFDVVMLVRIFASRVPDAEVVVFRTGTAGEIQGTTVPVYANDWTPSLPLVSPRATDVRLETESLGWLPVEIPGTRGRWIFSAITNDSGVIDVFESVGRKARRRLTFARGDDMLSGVSPDGSHALLVTGRWNADSHYDIGLLDLSTGSVSQLTSGDASDLGAQWSPDASRLAFVRRSWDDDGRRVCVIFPDGSELRCLDSLRSVNRILGWHDAESIVVEHEEGGAGVLSMMNVEEGARPPPPARLTQGGSALAELSPDGQWLVCQCERPGYVQGAWFVMRVGREAEARQLRIDARPGDVRPGDIRVGWRGSLTSGGIARITVRPGTGNPRVGVPHRLSLRAESSTGEEISAGSPRWSSGDTANAPIDSLRGVLFATRTGAVSVQGFLPGWRRTTRNLSVSPNAVSLALDERWDNGFGGRWVRFGSPTPVLDSTDGRFTMWNAGDGSLLSGVVLSGSLSPQAGVAVEAEVSVKITRPQWQQLQVAIAPSLDRPANDAQSMRDGVLNARRSVAGECRIIYPGAAEGRWAADTVAGLSGTEVFRSVALPGARKGQWMRFRVQLFPDGRCGFAIDGVPIAISERPSGIDVPVQIQLSGNSVGTRALVGRTRVWTGVPTDIDWTAFELRRSTRRDRK